MNYIIDVKEDEFIVYAISPLGADDDDKKMMSTMADFLCRTNYGLKNGNFELDMRDGEIRYKIFVDCESIIPTTEIVRNSIYCPAAMFDQYGVGIVDIIFGSTTAKEAIAKCEKSSAEEIRAILGEGEDMERMLARLATRFKIDECELRNDGEQTISDDETEVRAALFGMEGGAV